MLKAKRPGYDEAFDFHRQFLRDRVSALIARDGIRGGKGCIGGLLLFLGLLMCSIRLTGYLVGAVP